MPNIGYPDWINYFGDVMNFPIPQIPDQIFLIRPDYENLSPSSFENVMNEYEDDDLRSDCSCVDYIVEASNENSKDNEYNENNKENENNKDNENNDNINENMIEVSIETN